MEKEIEFRNLHSTPEWGERINYEIDRITEHHPATIHHLRFTLTSSRHQRLGLFEISLVAGVPQETIVVKNKGEFVRPLIVESFETLDRRLQEYNRKRQGLVKQHVETRKIGSITELVPMEDYGIITAADGTLVYFHRHAVKDTAYDELTEGALVEFNEEMGDKGPQATWVRRR